MICNFYSHKFCSRPASKTLTCYTNILIWSEIRSPPPHGNHLCLLFGEVGYGHIRNEAIVTSVGKDFTIGLLSFCSVPKAICVHWRGKSITFGLLQSDVSFIRSIRLIAELTRTIVTNAGASFGNLKVENYVEGSNVRVVFVGLTP